MSTKPEFLLYDRDGRLAAAVDVRARRDTTSQWAAELRRNLVDLGPGPFRGAPFLIVATLDRVYIWKGEPPTDLPVPPDYELDAEAVFSPYLEGTDRHLQEISAYGFELIVMSWLQDLVHPIPGLYRKAPVENPDLREAVKDGRIDFPAAA
jgi:hypothetical protein